MKLLKSLFFCLFITSTYGQSKFDGLSGTIDAISEKLGALLTNSDSDPPPPPVYVESEDNVKNVKSLPPSQTFNQAENGSEPQV